MKLENYHLPSCKASWHFAVKTNKQKPATIAAMYSCEVYYRYVVSDFAITHLLVILLKLQQG